MASSFPTSLDAFTNPSSTDALDSVSVPHATQHSDLNDAVEALEAKVGADSSAVTSSHDYKIAQLEAGATGGKILQVVSTTKTDTFTTSASSYTDITGLSVAITPSSATSKVLIIASVTGTGDPGNKTSFVQLVRDSTAIAVGDAAGNRTRAFASQYGTNLTTTVSTSIVHLDSPSTTSSTTYKIQGFADTTGTLYINRGEIDSDTTEYVRGASSITVMEVSA